MSSGLSWSLIICLSQNPDLLWTREKEWLVLQWVQRVGSAIRPRSTSTAAVNWQTEHLNSASDISGISGEVRITMPVMVIS